MKKLGFLLLFLFAKVTIVAQVTIVLNVPKSTTENERIFMASNLNNWNPTDEKFELKKNADGKYFIQIPESTGNVEYKFTRGSWETAEGKADGSNTDNRRFSFKNQPQTIENQVLSWQNIQKKNTRSKNVRILSENFSAPQLNTTRRIWIYLPEDYLKKKKKYPVFYMHDGQNLFDDQTSFSGEWQIDESLDKIFKETGKSAIVIGIDNGGEQRIPELSPFKNEKYGGGNGETYMRFIVETLKPYVDKNFRTKSGKKNTVLGGSSLGALISVYGAVKYPETFGKVLAFSNAFWFNLNELEVFIKNSNSNLSRQKYYFIQGKHESEDMDFQTDKIINALRTKNVKAKNIYNRTDEDGKHNEMYWRREFPAAFKWLTK
jgi:predicted alpha/beta superfamily hydrolase